MSIQSRSVTSCLYCSQTYHNGFDGQYCSKLCYFKRQGEKLLNTVRHDHTHCVNCGTKLKDISKPTDEQLRSIDGYHSKKAVIGYQYPRPESDTGIKDVGSKQVTGIICGECGNTRHNRTFPEIQDRHLFEYAEGILDALEGKSDEHNQDISRDVFFEMVVETRDIEFALGKAVA